ncbi:MAG: alpha-1,2-fucosyltransferase [Lachnospiraceae bacterium]|nr:alpha-1,2-fucosyltransferase [Lachnospiraceae bacterium]
MFIVRITSGLGNQMYQYCFYLLLKKLYPEAAVRADLTWFYANNDHFGYELQRIFGKGGFLLEEAGPGELFKVTGLIPNLFMPDEMLSFKNGKEYRGRFSVKSAKRFEEIRRYPNRIIREFTLKKRLPYLIDETGVLWENGPVLNNDDIYKLVSSLDTTKNYYFTGFWIKERYFGQVLNEAVKAFAFPEFEDEENIRLAEDIVSSVSVGIHVRRGDYLTAYKNSFISLPVDYYKEGIDAVCKGTGIDRDGLKFYIFSDDPEYIESAFAFLENKRVVAHNKGTDSFRDMQLMSLCRHNIIANSTFSQWAALLNRNKEHLTVYPKLYMKDEDSEVKTLKGWIRC